MRILCYVALISCCLAVSWSCTEPSASKTEPAFYHWQTQLQLTSYEIQYLDSLNVKRLYVKFFDVDWDARSKLPVPVAEVVMKDSFPEGLEIIPTIFITNRVFANLPKTETGWLAEQVHKKLNGLSVGTFQEVQFDCDWTLSTREKYFRFLTDFQALSGPDLKYAATIRLHQFKYPDKTGVPPVDRGMLMFYNTGNLEEWETENSILDLATAGQYLTESTPYPLPLDLALPLFKWGVLFRNGELTYLINDLGPADLRDTTYFLQTAPNRFKVLKSTYLHGYYLYGDDRVRLEAVSPELLEEAAGLLSRRLTKSQRPGKSQGQRLGKSNQAQPTYITFYHLDTTTLKAFQHEELQAILDLF